MKTRTTIETRIEELQFGYWDIEAEEFIPIDTSKAIDVEAAAVALSCSERLLDALGIFVENIKGTVGLDLCDIWERLDRLER
jgi:hypothetical protein